MFINLLFVISYGFYAFVFNYLATSDSVDDVIHMFVLMIQLLLHHVYFNRMTELRVIVSRALLPIKVMSSCYHLPD